MTLTTNKNKYTIIIAKSFLKRLWGLMGQKDINYGMLFPKCNSIHTFFMKENIDIIGLDENNEVIDIDARNIQIFDANMDEAAKFIQEHKGFQITIATDFQERVKEVFADYGLFDINYIRNITSQGTELKDGKILLLTDRELFNKRQKDLPAIRRKVFYLM